MNIIVRTYGGWTVARPDTTWEKDNEDFYPPESVTELSCAPVLFSKVGKPGKSIGKRFASRYFDEVGLGLLLYPENLITSDVESFASAICLDHSSFLPFPMFSPEEKGVETRVLRDGKDFFEYVYDNPGAMEDALAEVSKSCYLRVGDIVAAELSGRMPLVSRADGKVEVKGFWGEKESMDFSVIF